MTASPTYPPAIEQAIAHIGELLRGDYALSHRTIALLLLQDDAEIWDEVQAQESAHTLEQIRRIKEQLAHTGETPLAWQIEQQRQLWSQQLAAQVTQTTKPPRPQTLAEWAGWLCMNPWTGFPILALVLYFGLYQFVGVFGAGTVVGLIEENLFGEYINPFVERLVRSTIPWQPIQELLVGEYGVWTLGVTYAIALILPIVTFFFLVFAILEDTGYLPRLAMLIDRVFKALGLNGRAVIPIVLGFGCDTMATVVTRVLETRRERIITTFLLTLTIPCSAQLGVVLALLAQYPLGLGIWAGVIAGVFLLSGWLAAQVLPGRAMPFYMEIPPMRLPSLSNVLLKTLARLQWYFLEVLPLFLIASVLIWIGQLTGLFGLALRALAPLAQGLGLPSEAGVAFLFGFFRRDYGAAGLYDLQEKGLLTGNDILVVAVVLTLFVPCVAQFLVTIKERGVRAALAMFVLALGIALLTGLLLAHGLQWLGVSV
ncbi:MAG: ferrous iron transporter B [Fimbriimonadales bacterium]|nr:ferrous iron transporter B [Fimbriimonadales bacterium]